MIKPASNHNSNGQCKAHSSFQFPKPLSEDKKAVRITAGHNLTCLAAKCGKRCHKQAVSTLCGVFRSFRTQFTRACQGEHWGDQREDTLTPRFSIRSRQPPIYWKRLSLGNWLEMKKVAGVKIIGSSGAPKQTGEGTRHLTWVQTTPSQCCQIV